MIYIKYNNNDNNNNNKKKNKKRKIVITGDSLLNGINEWGLSKHHQVKIQNYPGGTSETIPEKTDTLVTSNPECLIVHSGTKNITKRINYLNSVKKTVKGVKEMSANTKVVFSGFDNKKR